MTASGRVITKGRLLVTLKTASVASSAVFLVACITAARKSDKDSPPYIAADAATFQFGKVTAGCVVEHSFTLTNSSDGAIVISDVRSSCGCLTVTSIGSRFVDAGGVTSVKTRLATAGIRGRVHKSIAVSLEGEAHPILLRMEGVVMAAP